MPKTPKPPKENGTQTGVRAFLSHPALKAFFSNDYARLGLILFALTAFVAGALGFVNSITEERIAAIAKENTERAMSAIVTGDARFEPVPDEKLTDDVVEAFEVWIDGQYAGLCVKTAPSGFGGAISMIVGIDAENKVIGVEIIKMSETPNLGTKAQEPAWLAQFAGKSGAIRVVKSGTGSEDDVVAVSGATVTSNAVASGVQTALGYAAAYTPEVR